MNIKKFIGYFTFKDGIYQKNFDRTYLLVQVCMMLIVICSINLYFVENNVLTNILQFFILLSLCAPFANKFINHYTISTNITILSYVANVTYLVGMTEGINSPFLIWFIGPVVLSAIFFRDRSIFIWSIIVFSILIYFLYQDILGKNLTIIGENENVVFLERLALIDLIIFVSSCLYFHARKIKSRLKWLYDGNEKVASLIQILSHDIINPLNLILGFTEILKEESDEEKLELTDGIQRASRQIKQIIDHVKEMQALESGKRNLELQPIEISKSLEDINFVFSEKAKKKGVSLIIQNELSKEQKIMAEKVSFSHQVMNNLVSNAIKFTPEHGEIIVHTYSKGNKVHINIQDTGVGIPQKLIPNLFRFDVATSRVGTQGELGTGFGLPLVKKYIELYNGEIYVESIEKAQNNDNDVHGTNFHIILNSA